ncbi:MAG TPA: type IV-A pilus assembly ATPase PilB [Candidatus Krumholzibacteria bacterium]|nr:type IV-A pilus assembly ATPase PilB [Candidatus Krumholzibacteria bacterium]
MHADAKIATQLLESSRLTREQLSDAEKVASRDKTSLGSALIRMGVLGEAEYEQMLSRQYGVPSVRLDDVKIPPDVISLVPSEVAGKFQVIPIARIGRQLTLAMANPQNIFIIDDVKFITGLDVKAVVCAEAAIKKAIDRYYDQADSLASVMKEMDGDIEVLEEEKDQDLGLAAAMDENAPVVKLVNSLLSEALRRGASDIHVEPYEHRMRVRYRVDGALHDIMSPPARMRSAVVSRLKIMSELDIAERRVPQDGRIKIKIKGKKVDVRLSTVPTIYGEKVVMRILDATNLQLDLKKLGFDPLGLQNLLRAIALPYGMVLVTGPTGSGKTTTLYSALSRLNTDDTNIMTAEDPVEYNIEGINQVQVNEEIGLTFATALKAFLRQDPNIIMVGEVRDLDTASIAVKAALTGHLVLSTVHTNDSASTINRLVDMGIEPFLVASSLNIILAQRLARRICSRCKAEVGVASEEVMRELGWDPKRGSFKMWKGKGCNDCNMTGYAGRLGLYEVLNCSSVMRELILERASSPEIKRKAMQEGMVTLRQHGISKIQDGITTVEEVLKETARDEVEA